MKRRDTLTALGFLAALALALAVVVSSCFGGEGALETLLKQALRDRDVQAVLDGAGTPEDILERTDLPVARVMTALTLLELDGVLARESGRIVIQ